MISTHTRVHQTKNCLLHFNELNTYFIAYNSFFAVFFYLRSKHCENFFLRKNVGKLPMFYCIKMLKTDNF